MKKIITIARLKQIANAIRQKTNKTGALTLGQMPAEINSIEIFKGVGKFSDLKIFIPTSITQAQWDAGYDSMKLLLRSADVSSLTFKNCSSLTSLDLSFWDGGKRKDMGNMFDSCRALTSLDLSNFNTANVTSMRYTFYNCQALTSLDLSSFNTANVTSMRYTFNNCQALTSLDLSSFDTANVTDMSNMFDSCRALTSLDLSNFNTANVTSMEYMFDHCQALTSLDLSNFNTANVASMGSMFYDCQALTSLDLSSFNTANVTSMEYMFNSCFKLSVINWPAVWSLAKYARTFDLSPCPLNHDSCLALFNALQDCSGRTVKLSTTTKELMSADELKIATDKGVTIA